MRNLFIIGTLLMGAFMAGWFKVNRDGQRTTIEINRDEIRGDTRNAIARGREYLQRRDQRYNDQQLGDQQYENQQYAEQQYPAQQSNGQPYGESNQQYWPRTQVAAQQDNWGNNYDGRQQPNTNYQSYTYPNQSQDQNYPAAQPQYQPQQYSPATNR